MSKHKHSKSHESLSEEQIRAAFKQYCNGGDLFFIASDLYVSTRTLQRMFKRRGLKKVSFTKNANNANI